MLESVRAVARRLTLDRQLDFWRRELAPPPRARIVSAQAETHDLSTFALEPLAAWPGHRAGQFVTIGVEIDGVRFQRCYSISSAPGAAPTITVKRIGKVSSWLHAKANVGVIVELGKPQGQFVVPPTARRLLLVTGGSGITPAMAILRDRRPGDDIVFVHAARSNRDVPFVDELRAAGAILFVDDVTGRLDGERLRAAVPDLHTRTTMLCGPAPMMESLLPTWEAMPERLVLERFTPARATGVRKVTRTSLTLLEALEQAGERPASGCRMGICNTCVCRKQSGVVENVITGMRSHDGEEDIHLCVSRAVTDVEIAR